MTSIIWSLILTVCSNDVCATQTIQWFDKQPDCLSMQRIHEKIPQDGEWQSVTYRCTIVGAKEI